MAKKDIYRNAGLAAVILLAPGGFILGATLAARHYRNKRRSAPAEEPTAQTDAPSPDAARADD